MNTQPQSAAPVKPDTLPTWRIVLHAVRYTFWLWVIDLISVFSFRVGLQLVPGLLLRSFFNIVVLAFP